MEHKLITGGGEIYLPFARSRIKALRASGRPYASQKFVIGGASITVRVTPGHEYVTLSGGEPVVAIAYRCSAAFMDYAEPGVDTLDLWTMDRRGVFTYKGHVTAERAIGFGDGVWNPGRPDYAVRLQKSNTIRISGFRPGVLNMNGSKYDGNLLPSVGRVRTIVTDTGRVFECRNDLSGVENTWLLFEVGGFPLEGNYTLVEVTAQGESLPLTMTGVMGQLYSNMFNTGKIVGSTLWLSKVSYMDASDPLFRPHPTGEEYTRSPQWTAIDLDTGGCAWPEDAPVDHSVIEDRHLSFTGFVSPDYVKYANVEDAAAGTPYTALTAPPIEQVSLPDLTILPVYDAAKKPPTPPP